MSYEARLSTLLKAYPNIFEFFPAEVVSFKKEVAEFTDLPLLFYK